MTDSRRKGRRYELDVTAWLTAHGIDVVDRNRSGFTGDDLWLPAFGLSVECKNHKTTDLAGWCRQAQTQADAAPWVVIHKRRGSADVGDHYVTTVAETFLRIARGETAQ